MKSTLNSHNENTIYRWIRTLDPVYSVHKKCKESVFVSCRVAGTCEFNVGRR